MTDCCVSPVRERIRQRYAAWLTERRHRWLSDYHAYCDRVWFAKRKADACAQWAVYVTKHRGHVESWESENKFMRLIYPRMQSIWEIEMAQLLAQGNHVLAERP